MYIPLNTPVTYEDTKPFAHELARQLENQHTDLVVSDMKKALRVGKVFVDWSQNSRHKTTVAVYSLRARPRPTVSTPVTWEEVERGIEIADFTIRTVPGRLAKMGDLWKPLLAARGRFRLEGVL